MSSRLAGAILALTAAALLALSLLGIPWAWWDGHPTMTFKNPDGVEKIETITAKTIHVGPLTATGCNTGGNGECSGLPMPAMFVATGYGEAALSSLLALGLIVLAIATLRGTEGRQLAAKLVIGFAIAAAVVAIVLLAEGAAPKTDKVVKLPLGYGMFVFAGGVVTAILGSILAMRPLPKVELRPSRAAIAPGLAAPPLAQPVDVLALLQAEPVRPTPVPSLGPGPMIRRAPPQTAGPLAGPAGPLGAPGFHAPPPPPTQPPPPLMPVPMLAAMPVPTPAAPSPPARPITTQGAAAIPNPPPPPRPKPMSVAPPPPRIKPVSIPPPPGAIAARLKASSVPPPVRAGSMPVPTTPRTLAAAVVPPPASATPKPPFKLPVRAVTDPSDHSETIDRDAMTIDRQDDAAVQVGRPSTGGEIGDSTDASVALPEVENTAVNAPLDTATDEIATLAVEKHEAAEIVAVPPRPPSEAETKAREKVEAEVARESQSEIQTIAREKLSARELLDTGDSTNPALEAAAQPAAPKIPITTAPDSLPPPTAKQTASSGPSPACPQCESPMAWVEEHLRFYCKSCRMYF